MTLPMSSSATWSSMTVPPWSWTTSTFTASGSSTRDLATYSTRSAAAIGDLLLLGRQDAGGLEQAGDRVGRLGALGKPRRRLLGVDVELDRLGPGVVVADRRDRPAVPGRARVGDDHAVGWLLPRDHARQPDADCHRCCVSSMGLAAGVWGAGRVDGFGADGSVHRQGARARVDGSVLVDGADQGIEVLEIGSIFLQVLGPLVGRHVLLDEWLDQAADRRDVEEAQREVLGADALDQALEPGVIGQGRTGAGVEDGGDEGAPVADHGDVRRERPGDL